MNWEKWVYIIIGVVALIGLIIVVYCSGILLSHMHYCNI